MNLRLCRLSIDLRAPPVMLVLSFAVVLRTACCCPSLTRRPTAQVMIAGWE